MKNKFYENEKIRIEISDRRKPLEVSTSETIEMLTDRYNSGTIKIDSVLFEKPLETTFRKPKEEKKKLI